MAQGVLKRFCRPAKHAACVKIVTQRRFGCTRAIRGCCSTLCAWKNDHLVSAVLSRLRHGQRQFT